MYIYFLYRSDIGRLADVKTVYVALEFTNQSFYTSIIWLTPRTSSESIPGL